MKFAFWVCLVLSLIGVAILAASHYGEDDTAMAGAVGATIFIAGSLGGLLGYWLCWLGEPDEWKANSFGISLMKKASQKSKGITINNTITALVMSLTHHKPHAVLFLLRSTPLVNEDGKILAYNLPKVQGDLGIGVAELTRGLFQLNLDCFYKDHPDPSGNTLWPKDKDKILSLVLGGKPSVQDQTND